MKSFDEVFQVEFRLLHRYLARRVGPAVAEDLCAATFAAAYANWHKLEPSRAVRPWLYGIAANQLRHHWRRERRMLHAYARSWIDAVQPDIGDVVDRLDAQASLRSLAAALASLRREDREILLLHAWAGLTDQEVAEALGLPLGTVKSRLHRARERIRNQLGEVGQSASRTLGESKAEGIQNDGRRTDIAFNVSRRSSRS
jgi:RNA polymerase sigma factor (sigma-70 family)